MKINETKLKFNFLKNHLLKSQTDLINENIISCSNQKHAIWKASSS